VSHSAADRSGGAGGNDRSCRDRAGQSARHLSRGVAGHVPGCDPAESPKTRRSIVVLMGIVVAKLPSSGGPHGQAVNADWLQLPPGTALGMVGLASTFGFLFFAGFESAGSLGEESHRPLRRVPRAMAMAIAVGFYVACTAVQSLGFGTDPAASAPLQTRRRRSATSRTATSAPAWRPLSTSPRSSVRSAPASVAPR
jgi:hypothetical protein